MEHPAEPSSNDAAYSENIHWDFHRRRCIGSGLAVEPRFSVEGQKHHAPGVASGQEGGKEARQEQQRSARHAERFAKYRVFGEKAGEPWNSRERQRSSPHCLARSGQLPPEAAHVLQILLATERVYDRSRSQKEQRFE